MTMLKELKLNINGKPYEFTIRPKTLLVELLRNELKLTGTKRGCTCRSCGACTVHLDGKAVRSCSILALQASGRNVTTIEGLAVGDKLHPVQQAFVNNQGLECGFCCPGMIMSATALLAENPKPTEPEIRSAINGNLCACTGYQTIVEAIQIAAKNMREGK